MLKVLYRKEIVMKIYKLSQNVQQPPQQPQTPQQNQNTQEANAALQKLMYCVQTINASLQVLQQYDITKLLQKNTLIGEIQSGNLMALDQTKIQASIEAMSRMATVVPTYNAAMKVLKDSGADIPTIQNSVVTLINQGATVQTGNLSMFQNALPSASGIQMPANLSQ